MTRLFAYECFADEDVFRFLRDALHFPIRSLHAFGQGPVVHELLVSQRADIGMVDEDPLSSHHRQRDTTEVVSTSDDIMHRRRGDRHLIILRPALEECFLRSVKRAGLESGLPSRPAELRTLLNIPGHRVHQRFREELRALHRESQARSVRTLVTELEAVLRRIA